MMQVKLRLMKMILESPRGANLVRRYAPQEIMIGEQVFRHTVVIAPETLLSDLHANSLAEVTPAALQKVIALRPDVILATHAGAAMPAPAALRKILAPLKIAIEPMNAGAACRTYNVLVQEGRRPALMWFPDPAAEEVPREGNRKRTQGEEVLYFR